jgi:hypothetical protein
MLTTGFTMPLEKLDDKERLKDVQEALKYGNHKSTQQNPTIVREMLNDEVIRGWQLVLPRNSIGRIPEAIVSPLGLVRQNTINEMGETIQKWRITHDQSFKFQSGTSVNSRVQKEKLTDCMFGAALRRFIHSIIHYRRKYPSTPLLMAKYDLKSAYRRAHLSGVSALQSIATSRGLHIDGHEEDELAYVSLRLTFGGSPNPSEFSAISETITDLTNIILQHRDWNPATLHSEFNALIDENPRLLALDVEFAEAREPLMEWELSDFGATDVYIDDIFNVFPMVSDDYLRRGQNAALLAIDLLGRPTQPDDPLPRDPLVAVKKVLAEGSPTEVLTILGWIIDTRRLIIQLPDEKADTWDNELKSLIIDADKGLLIGLKRLEKIQGRNIRVAAIVPGALHFQSRMYSAIVRAKQHKQTRLRAEERHDLELFRHLLAVARRGISLNNMIVRRPDHLGRSDAFERGIGGYDLTSGRAWRFEIPEHLQHRKSQNFLEYLACMTQLMCLLYDCDWRPGDSFLCIGDNTSALGWIQKSRFCPEKDPDQTTHLALARHVTLLIAELDVVQFGLWRPGTDNGVADALSRRHDLTDEELTNHISLSYPEQTPPGFRIMELPPEITLWTLFWVQHGPDSTESPPTPLPRAKPGGNDGSSFFTTASSETTSSFDSSPPTNDSSYSAPLHTEPETTSGPCPRKDMIIWLREHAVPPLTQFARPSCQPVGTIPAKIRTATLRSFYNDKFEDTKTTIQRSNLKRPFPSGSSKN